MVVPKSPHISLQNAQTKGLLQPHEWPRPPRAAPGDTISGPEREAASHQRSRPHSTCHWCCGPRSYLPQFVINFFWHRDALPHTQC